ncbi:hypothetical protein JYU34_021461 [Plutella xylostella]|uniref:Uncharacterized protein n=1 Tax=Plutella xylostella TaxID=51655 RepID=A0ABQ7PTM1_PLUXY|nr:hypothetical protein JYU34_021461 [Plutella xylostella]
MRSPTRCGFVSRSVQGCRSLGLCRRLARPPWRCLGLCFVILLVSVLLRLRHYGIRILRWVLD